MHRTGTLDTGVKVPKVRGKPSPGCPFGLPGPSADWQRTDTGWIEANGKPVTEATALVINPRGDGCAGETN